MPPSDHISIQFAAGSLGFNFQVVDENTPNGRRLFKVLKTQPAAQQLGVRVGHNIEHIGGVAIAKLGHARAVFEHLNSAPRPLTIIFSNNKNVGGKNEDSLAQTYRSIGFLCQEFGALRKAGEFQNNEFETVEKDNGIVMQLFERTHTEYKNTAIFVSKVTTAVEKSKLDGQAAHDEFLKQFSLLRRHNPLSRKREARQDAQTNLVTRCEGVTEKLNGILTMAQYLERRRAPHQCERDADTTCKSTLRTDPCWVYGGADHVVDGVPSITSFYSTKNERP